jgi:site-specific DNA recombinase
VYKGQYVYGRRSKTNREMSMSRVPAIIDEHTWEMAQQRLEKNRHFAMRNAKRKYLLRGLITCGVCKLNYHGTQVGRRRGKQFAYYICNGKMPFHRRLRGKCTNTAVPSEALEQALWAKIVDFIRNPGPVLQKLADYLRSREDQAHTLEQERMTQALALSHKEKERDSILDLYRRGLIPVTALERQIEKIAEEEGVLRARLATIETTMRGQKAIAQRLTEAQNMLQRMRAELKEDFTWEEQRGLIEQLVMEIVITPSGEGREKKPLVDVTYCFDEHAVRCSTVNYTNSRAGVPRGWYPGSSPDTAASYRAGA